MCYKGIFWYDPKTNALICKKVFCDKDGKALENVLYTSKSGENFNHEAEWQKISRSITNGRPYNYYPRGRVEIKNGKATVYLNPILKVKTIQNMINSEFNLNSETIPVRFCADGSFHYNYLIQNPHSQA